MAKKDTPLDNDELNLDILDLDELDNFIDVDQRDDRSPVRRFISGVKKGFMNQARDRVLIKRFAQSALPDGYSRLMSAGDASWGEIKRLVKETQEDTGYELNQIADAMATNLAKLKGRLPDHLYEKAERNLERFRYQEQDDTPSYALSQDQRDDDTLADGLASLSTAASTEHEADQEQLSLKESQLRDYLESRRFDLLSTQLDIIGRNLADQSTFNEEITYKYQRKSLELQYRSYFALRDLKRYASLNQETQEKAYTALVHNTGLPDHLKLQKSERVKFGLRDGLTTAIGTQVATTVSEHLAQFYPQLGDNIKTKLMEVIRAGGQLAAGASMTDGTGIDGVNTAGELAGDMAGSKFRDVLLDRAAIAARPAMNQMGDALGGQQHMLSYLLNNLPAILQDYTEDLNQTGGIRGFIHNLVRSVSPTFLRDDTLEDGSYQTIDRQAAFNQLTQRSIVEIIPGYLSRILQETRMLRTGRDDIEREVYDVTAGKFTGYKDAKGNLMKRVINESQRRNIDVVLNDAVDQYDPEQALTTDARNALREKLLRDSSQMGYFKASDYLEGTGFSEGTRDDTLEELKAFFQAQFDTDDDGKVVKDPENLRRLNAFSDAFLNVRNVVPDPKKELGRLSATGNLELLQDLNLLDTRYGQNRVNYDTVNALYRGDGQAQGGRDTPLPVDQLPRTRISTGYDNVPPIAERLRNARVTGKERLQNISLRNPLGRQPQEQAPEFTPALLDAILTLDNETLTKVIKWQPQLETVLRERDPELDIRTLPYYTRVSASPRALHREVVTVLRTLAGETPTDTQGASPTPTRQQNDRLTSPGYSFTPRSTQRPPTDTPSRQGQEASSETPTVRGGPAPVFTPISQPPTPQGRTPRVATQWIFPNAGQVSSPYISRETPPPSIVSTREPRQTPPSPIMFTPVGPPVGRDTHTDQHDTTREKETTRERLTRLLRESKEINTVYRDILDSYENPEDPTPLHTVERWVERARQSETVPSYTPEDPTGTQDIPRTSKLPAWGDASQATPASPQETIHHYQTLFKSLKEVFAAPEKTTVTDRLNNVNTFFNTLKEYYDRQAPSSTTVRETAKKATDRAEKTVKRIKDAPVVSRWLDRGNDTSTPNLSSATYAPVETADPVLTPPTQTPPARSRISPIVDGVTKWVHIANENAQAQLDGFKRTSQDYRMGSSVEDANTRRQVSQTAPVTPGVSNAPTLTHPSYDRTYEPPQESEYLAYLKDIYTLQQQHNDTVSQFGQRVVELMESGVQVQGVVETQNGEIGVGSATDSDSPTKKKGKVRGTLGAIGKGTRASLPYLRRYYGAVFKGMGKGAKGSASLAGTVLGGIGRSLTGQREDKSEDVYVKGNPEPVLKARDIKAGRYYDVENDSPIASIDDINGIVWDMKDQAVAISYEDYEKGLYNRSGEGILKKTARNVLGFYSDVYLKGAKNLVTSIPGAAQITKDVIAPERNAYLPGEKKPRLRTDLMKQDFYFNEEDGSPIRRYKDIKGTIVDRQGEVVVDESDIPELVGRDGRPLESTGTMLGKGLGATLGVPKAILKGGFKASAKVAKNLVDLGSAVSGRVIDMIRGTTGMRKQKVASLDMDERKVTLLGGIYDLLIERLPEPKRKMRKGSWREQLNAQQKKKEEETAQKEGGDFKGGKFGVLGTALNGLYERFKDRDDQQRNDEEEDEDGGDDTIIAAAGGGMVDKAKDLGKRAWQRTGKIARGAWKYGKYGAVGAGKLAFTGGAAVVGALGAPVVVAGTAIAAGATAGYFAYKNHQVTKGAFRQLRLTQYGFPSGWFKGRANNLLAMEALLNDHVRINGDEGEILIHQVDQKALVDALGVDIDDEPMARVVAMWFERRFKPIFLRYHHALKQLAPSATLMELDDTLDREVGLDFLDRVTFPYTGQTPYAMLASPFDPEEQIEVTVDDIKAKVQAVKDEYTGVQAERERSRTPSATSTGGTASIMASVNNAVERAKGPAEKPVSNVPTLTPQAIASAVTLGQKTPSYTTPASRPLVVSQSVPTLRSFSEQQLTSLQAIRLRAYGVVDLIQHRVANVFALEDKVFNHLQYRDGKMEFAGSPNDLFEEVASLFGFSTHLPPDSTHSDKYRFRHWFLGRFLSTLLAYVGVVRQADDSVPLANIERRLSDQQKLNAGHAMMAATVKEGGESISVFNHTAVLFNDPQLGDAQALAQRELDVLEKKARELRLGTPTQAAETRSEASEGGSTSRERLTSKALSSALQVAGGPRPQTPAQRRANTAWGGGGGVTGPTSGSPTPSSRGQGPAGGRGNTFGSITKGNGGRWEEIPMPQSNKSYAAAKSVFDAVQQMTGVSADLLATIASIESAFDYKVKAKTSSATGWFQFIKKTWLGMIEQKARKYGIPQEGLSENAILEMRKDPRINALMGAEFLKGNFTYLQNKLGRQPTDTDIYMAHFLGPWNAYKFLRMDQGAIAANTLKDQARANKPIFYKPSGQARTVGEVYALMDEKVSKHRYGDSRNTAMSVPETEPDPVEAPPGSVDMGGEEVIQMGPEGLPGGNNMISREEYDQRVKDSGGTYGTPQGRARTTSNANTPTPSAASRMAGTVNPLNTPTGPQLSSDALLAAEQVAGGETRSPAPVEIGVSVDENVVGNQPPRQTHQDRLREQARQADLRQQAQNADQYTVNSRVHKTLNEQLTVQKEMAGYLKDIAAKLGPKSETQKKEEITSSSTNDTSRPVASNTTNARPRDHFRPAVPMTRTV